MAFEYYNYNTETGVVVPDTSSLKAEVEAEFKEIFGNDFSMDPASPEGRLVAYETECRRKVIENNASVANIINPNTTFGVLKYFLAALFNQKRTGDTSSLIDSGILYGVSGAVIPEGSIARTSNGDNFILQGTVTISATGSVVANFESQAKGPIPCAPGELDTIVTPILGWERVSNTAGAILGETVESDSGFDIDNKYQAKALFPAIKSALSKVDGVRSVNGYENYDGNPVTVAGVTIPGHCIYVVVDGGSDSGIVDALFKTKSAGCNFQGNVTVIIYDGETDYPYTVRFARPIPKYAAVNVSIQSSSVSASSSDITQTIYNFINDYKIAKSMTVYELSGLLMQEYSGIIINDLQIGNKGGTIGYAAITYNMNEVARVESLADISVNLS